jgi:hypothetical protein
VVEYGNGISKGPAGQVAGSGHPVANGGDPFANIGHVFDQGVATLSGLSPIELVVLAVVVVTVGLFILRKAF